jgi:carboxyl-terminal processing protease
MTGLGIAFEPLRRVSYAAALLCLGFQASAQQGQSRSLYEDMRMFSQVLNQIRTNHPDSLDTHVLLMAAIEGMVRAADPHSYVLPATRLSPEKEKAMRDGELYPVPINFGYLAGAPFVVSVQPGSRAAELNIVPGDELVAIDGEVVTAESAAELDIVLAGSKGSTVNLTFSRRRFDGSRTTVIRRVKRERVEESSAIGAAFMLGDSTGYLRLLHFDNLDVANEFRNSLNRLERAGLRRLVLDLRDNGGGFVKQASTVASEFLPNGAIVYTAEGRKQDVNDTSRVERPAEQRQLGVPVVVIVNSGTASAAELVAGALQDHDRALIVGRPTFGKSLLMRPFPMTDGSVIHLVVGQIRTPCGRVVQRPYRDLRTADYFRMAGAIADTTGRPTCQTDGGRTVYGGGGIYPDVLFQDVGEAPEWYLQVQEEELLIRWIGSYLNEQESAETTPAEFAEATLPRDVVENFIAFAAEEGVDEEEMREYGSQVHELLLRTVAWGRWGASGFYTVAALHDRDVSEAIEHFDEAVRLIDGH